ncbi:hypothetical protein OAT16_02530 [Prolixibacteraceae bacterium]|nr:hypothetical protein [Prolixibacteraceae bacterium]
MVKIKKMTSVLLILFVIIVYSCSNKVDQNMSKELSYPTNVKATFDKTTETVQLSWDAVEDASRYTIWYAYTTTSPYEFLAEVNTTEYNDDSIDRESNRFYKIKCYSEHKESIYSIAISVANNLKRDKHARKRAMWVWKNKNGLEKDNRAKLLSFCKEKGIEIVYFSTGTSNYVANTDLKTKTRKFIREAHNHNIEVHGLTGNPIWITPEKQHVYLDAVRNIVAYNNTVDKIEQFDGYQSDIEPNKYVSKKLPVEERIKNLTHYISVHHKAAEIFNTDLNNPNDFDYGMAISSFYDTHGTELNITFNGKSQGTLYHLADIVDYFAIMSYRDKASALIDISQTEVNLMAKLGKKAWTGVETIDTDKVGAGGDFINFAQEGNQYMEGEIAKVTKHYDHNKGFGGIAIHYYTTYSTLKE